MDIESLKKAVQKLRKTKKRNFEQSFDLIISLRDLDMNKPSENLKFYMSLPKNVTKTKKICAFVAGELEEQAKKHCDKVITVPEFDKYNKKKSKKLANGYDYFIAQANIMVKVAKKFGRILGVRGKMPNPKAGCVVPPKGNVKDVVKRLQTLIPIKTKKDPVVHATVAKESADDDDIVKNAKAVINQVLHHLPNGQSNIKTIYLKLTMSKPIKLDEV